MNINMAALKFLISLLSCVLVFCDDGVSRENPFIRPVLEYLNGNLNSVYDYKSGTVLSTEKKANIIELSAQIDVNCNNRFPEIPCNERAFICHAFLGQIPENPDEYQVMSDVRCSPKVDIVVDESDDVQRPVSPIAFAETGRIDLSNEALQPGQEKADFVAIQRDTFPCLGCPYDLNKDAEGVDELLATALKHIESERSQRHKVINVKRLQQQVVAGLKFILQIEVAATTCGKDADVSAPCILDTSVESFVCEITFLQKPWISKGKHIIRNNCTSSQEFEPRNTGFEKDDIENEILPHQGIQDGPSINIHPSEPNFDAMANTGQIEENMDPNRLTDLESQILLGDIAPSHVEPSYAEPPVEEFISNQNQFSEPISYNNRRTLYASMPIVDEIEPIISMYPPQFTPDTPLMIPVDIYHERLSRELKTESQRKPTEVDVTTISETLQENRRVRKSSNKDDDCSSSSSSSSSSENNQVEVKTKNSRDDSSSSSSDDEEKDKKDKKEKMRKQHEDDSSSSSSSDEDDKKRNKRAADVSSNSSSTEEDKDKNEVKEKVKDDSSSSNDDDDRTIIKRAAHDSSSSSNEEDKDKKKSSSSDEDKKRNTRSVGQMEPILPEEKFIVRDLADFAVTDHDNEDIDHQKTTILQILGAKKLVLDGRIYYQIIMRLGTSQCHENDYREDCREKLITHLTKICKMQVRVDMDYSNPKVVKSRCQQVKKSEEDRNRTYLKRSRRSPTTPAKTCSKIFDNLTDDAIIYMALQHLSKKSDQTIPTYFEHSSTISSHRIDRIHYSSISAEIRQCQGRYFSSIVCKERILCQFQFFNNLAYKQNGRILVKCEKAGIDLYVPIGFEEALGGEKLDEAFRSFVELFEKKYESETQRLYRQAVFKNNLKKIDLLNKNEQGTATYGITEFADMTEKEFSESRGFKPELRSENDPLFPMAQIPNIEIPVEYDWRQKGAVTKVKNQGLCGSCWAFSVTGNVEGQYAVKHGKLLEFSEQELVDCDKTDEGCNGGLMDNAYRAIEKLGGLESESDYPYEGDDETCHFNSSKVEVRLTGAVNISHNETDMAKWLSSNGPISIAINANAMQFYFGGVSHPFKFLCDPNSLDHGVLIVGYGIDNFSYLKKKIPYWIVKNSWGTSWGEQGYYRVYRGDGTCGLNQTPSSAIIE